MAGEPKSRRRLVNLEIDEASAVDRPANLMPGWIVIKSENSNYATGQTVGFNPTMTTTKADSPTGSKSAAIVTALRLRAETLGLTVDDQALEGIAAQALNDGLKGHKFRAADYDDQLRSAASTPATKAATPTLTEIIEALRRQAALEGVTVTDAALARIAADAVDNMETDAFEVLDYADALREAGTSPATQPKPLDSHARAPRTAPVNPAGGGGRDGSLPAAQSRREKPFPGPGTADSHPTGTRPVPTLKDASAAYREAHRDEAIERQAAELERQGRSREEAIRKATTDWYGPDLRAARDEVAKALVDAGQARPGEATIRATRMIHGKGTTTVTKADPDPEVAEVAAEIYRCRMAKGFTQSQLADEVGVTGRQVANWESGSDVPNGLNATRVAAALDGGTELARMIAAARSRS